MQYSMPGQAGRGLRDSVSCQRALYGQEQLRLDVLVEIVESSYCLLRKRSARIESSAVTIRCTVADDDLGTLAVKVLDDLFGRGKFGDVALNLDHARDRRHRLQVHGDNLGRLGAIRPTKYIHFLSEATGHGLT